MNQHLQTEGNPKRVVIRVHEHWLDHYQKVVQDWFRYCGYATTAEPYAWFDKHYVHLLGVNDRRFHIIIDMEKKGLKSPLTQEIPYEIYRLRKPDDATANFVYIDPVKQKDWYSFAREFTNDIPWATER